MDAQIDALLRKLARGKLDRQSRDQLLIELAHNPLMVCRLAEHLRALPDVKNKVASRTKISAQSSSLTPSYQ